MKHLKPDGILAVHISNKGLDLRHVLKALSAAVNRTPHRVINPEAAGGSVDEADWVLVTNNQRFLLDGRVRPKIDKRYFQDRKPVLWTDDFRNLVGLLK